MNVAVLITCHNRREKTLRCLHALVEAASEVKGKSVGISVFLVDDGSTDGTSESVLAWYRGLPPHSTSAVNIQLIAGTGDLFWAKSMALAWHEALKSEEAIRSATPTFTYNYFLWLNDDVELYSNALRTLCSTEADDSTVLVGKVESSTNSAVKTYGVVGKWFNGNFVLIPRKVSDVVGIISDEYTHAKADYDYAERVRRAGFKIAETDYFVGVCRNDFGEKYRSMSLVERLILLRRPGYWNLHDLWLFQTKYYGGFRALLCCAKLTAIVLRGVRQ